MNSQRRGFVVNADGTVEERAGNFFNADLRITKGFSFGARARVKVYADLFNLFNTENLSFTLRPEQSAGERGELVHAAGVALRPGLRAAGRPSVHGIVRRAVRVLKRAGEQDGNSQPPTTNSQRPGRRLLAVGSGFVGSPSLAGDTRQYL